MGESLRQPGAGWCADFADLGNLLLARRDRGFGSLRPAILNWASQAVLTLF